MPSAGERPRVFISYSRREASAFVDELAAGLEVAGFEPMRDLADIATGELWEQRLAGLIAQADTVVFVVSPAAVSSPQCQWEVDKTLDLSKRLLPVVYLPVPLEAWPARLRSHNFLTFDTAHSFARPLAQLATALRQDLPWIREHTRLGEVAARWQARGRPDSMLLRGEELDAAKTWAAARNAAAPEITAAQRALLDASEQGESARLSNERAQLDAMRRAQETTARSQKRVGRLLLAIAVMMLAMFGYMTWQSREIAKREINVFTARADEALRDGQFDRAMRYALQAYPARGSIGLFAPFSTELEGKLAGAAQSSHLRWIQKGHADAVLMAAFSSDGRRIVTTSRDGTTRLWDAGSGEAIELLENRPGIILGAPGAAFSPDGRRLVTWSDDSTPRLWNAERGQQIAPLEGHTKAVSSAAFSPDGRRVVTASDDNTARLWDAEQGKPNKVLTHPERVESAMFSPDGRRLVTSTFSGDGVRTWLWDARDGSPIAALGRLGSPLAFSPDGKRLVTAAGRAAWLWDAERGNEIAPLEGHAKQIAGAAFSPDSKQLVTASEDGTARVWDGERGNTIGVLDHGAAVLGVSDAAFSPDGKRIVTTSVTASANGVAQLWNAENRVSLGVLKDWARGVAFSKDGREVLIASSDGTASQWTTERGALIATRRVHPATVSLAAFSSDRTQVLTASPEGAMRLSDVVRDDVEIARFNDYMVPNVMFSPDGRRVVTASTFSSDGTASLRDAEHDREIAALKGHRNPVASVAFSPDGRWMVSTSYDMTARLWDAERGTGGPVYRGHKGAVVGAAFSADGKRLVTASMDKTARTWDVESGSQIAELTGHTKSVSSAAFSADGRRVVTASEDNTARIWDAARGSPIAVLAGHEKPVSSAAFSPDGTRVVTASQDGTARLWDAEHGDPLVTLTGHASTVRSAAFSPDGRRIVTASQDGTARLWDAGSGSVIALLGRVRSPTVLTATFSPDGKRIITTSSDRTARSWDVTWATLVRGDELRERVCAEKLVGLAQEFTPGELSDPILRGIDPNDLVARNPCLRRGPLSLVYWTPLPFNLWHALRKLVGAG